MKTLWHDYAYDILELSFNSYYSNILSFNATSLTKFLQTNAYAVQIQYYLFPIGRLNANVAPVSSLLFSAHILPP